MTQEKPVTCGQCAHAKFHPNGDLRMRSCHGGPPQVVQILGPKGASLAQFWPQVTVNDETCGRFEQRPPEIFLGANVKQ